MSAPDDRQRRALRGALFGLIACFAAADLIGDAGGGIDVAHVLVEGALTTLALVGLALEVRDLTRTLRAARAQADELRQRLGETQREAERWAREHRTLAGAFASAIDAQLERWGLSDAEKETAFLLLKGLSHKEIGELRGVGEASARQQARAIYRKAGLSGRRDLAAFFLEDVMSGTPTTATPRERNAAQRRSSLEADAALG